MKRVAVIGAGISGLSVARMLRDKCCVKVFERESKPGGLIKCERILGSLFHTCGGHVFNSKNQRVLDWFWSLFDKNRDFIKADRRSAVCLDGNRFVDYPIENHLYQLDPKTESQALQDVRAMCGHPLPEPDNFEDFLKGRFGKTLYELYFRPYNEKVWRRNLRLVPLSWLAGKLPMPTPEEILSANENHLEEKEFVHSSFYYEKENGSQFIADTLAKGLDVVYGADIKAIDVSQPAGCLVNGERFDEVVFCGNLKDLPMIINGMNLGGFAREIELLEYHGTTAAFCETDAIPYSWFYQPSLTHQSHRFICTGNFSPTNNAPGKMTCTVEFTDYVEDDSIRRQLMSMPFNPRLLCSCYNKYTYPIQHVNTRSMIKELKMSLAKHKIRLVGRFAEWEYYNMDAAMESAIRCCDEFYGM